MAIAALIVVTVWPPSGRLQRTARESAVGKSAQSNVENCARVAASRRGFSSEVGVSRI